MEEGKIAAIEGMISEIEKKFGKGSIMKFGETDNMDIPSVPTGSLGIDIALGIGGVPRGRVIEIYGPESSGKTTLALHIVAETQRLGGFAGYIDAEHALDPVYARKIGVDIDELYISQPDDGEQALEIAESMVRSGAIEVVVIDSVAALTPRAEINGEMGDSHMGLQARLMSQALRKLTAIINKTGCIVIFINQLREKIGIMFGSNETTTGGRALKFYASVRIDIRKGEQIKVGTEPVGARTKIKISKNKVAPPFRTCEFDIIFGEGIAKESDILQQGLLINVVNKSGSWFSYGDQRLGQGRENVRQTFKERPGLQLEIENKIRAHYKLPLIKEITDAEEEKSQPGKKSKRDKKEKQETEIPLGEGIV